MGGAFIIDSTIYKAALLGAIIWLVYTNQSITHYVNF